MSPRPNSFMCCFIISDEVHGLKVLGVYDLSSVWSITVLKSSPIIKGKSGMLLNEEKNV